MLDDDEREKVALDPNDAIVCSFCGLPQTTTRNFDKSKCKSTQYCNTTCQKKHWINHRTECQRLRAELNRKRQEKKIQRVLADSNGEAVGEQKDSVPLLESKMSVKSIHDLGKALLMEGLQNVDE